MVVFTSWQNYAAVAGRAKGAKEQSMKTAIKSITGNGLILQLHLFLAWGRYANLLMLDKKNEEIKSYQVQLGEAVEQARVAVEEDLVKAEAEVNRIKEEIATKTKEAGQLR